MNLEQTRNFIDKLFGEDMHAARVASLANAAPGVRLAAVVSIHAIGQGYALSQAWISHEAKMPRI